MLSNGSSLPVNGSSSTCNQCGDKRSLLPYIFPTQSGKREFCSEPCLSAYRSAQKGLQPSLSLPPQTPTNDQTAKNKSSDLDSQLSPRSQDDQLSESQFSWPDYLRETAADAAPDKCFTQSFEPPPNEFELDSKLEAKDPRSQSNCIATVVGKMGSRIRLRLDGSDSKNDFWRLVDSDDLHVIGYTQDQGQMLQPPVGFTLNATHWPKFYAKTLAGASFAKRSWFKSVPKKPEKNLFKIGQKLEAVDRKNPHLICCATIGAISEKGLKANCEFFDIKRSFLICFFYCRGNYFCYI